MFEPRFVFILVSQDIQKAINDSGAAEIVAKLPDGLETEMSATFSNLSVGQRQRLVIARAFLRNAPILLLDEPTSALDVRSEELVTEAIGRLRLGRTCVMITHRISTARDADFVVGENRGDFLFLAVACRDVQRSNERGHCRGGRRSR